LAPGLTGYLADVTGRFDAGFYVAIVLQCLALVALLFAGEARQRRASA